MVFLWNLKNNIICLFAYASGVVYRCWSWDIEQKEHSKSFFWHFFLPKLITSDELVWIFQTACEICEMVVPKIKDFVSKNTTQVRFFFLIYDLCTGKVVERINLGNFLSELGWLPSCGKQFSACTISCCFYLS